MSGKKKTIEQIYQKKTPLEHILLRPDTYVGSIEKDKQLLYVLTDELEEISDENPFSLSSNSNSNSNDNDNSNSNSSSSSSNGKEIVKNGKKYRRTGKQIMAEEEIEFVPALYKIFDEILVNAADNKQRDSSMSYIDVTIDKEKGFISIENDGKGIPIEIHKEHKIYVPEMIFGHLLTSSNYNDDDKKTVGGRNGYGAKLANIFSIKFTVETVDSSKGKKYRQTWKNNMQSKGEAKITDTKSKDYTKVTFYPDFNRFKMSGFESGIIKLMKKRVYDIAGTTSKNLIVKLNGKKIKENDFESYAKLYFKEKKIKGKGFWHITPNDRWEIIFAISDDNEFRQVSHVNNIWTIKGGTHVDSISKQFVKFFKDNFKAPRGKAKDAKELKDFVKPKVVKDHLFIFINCLIENPAFGSQTKEQLTTKVSAFGSRCSLPSDTLTSITKKISSDVFELLEMRARQQGRKTDGKKKSRLQLDAEYDDAKKAGTRESQKCTLILTEGLSAKTLAVAGVSVLPGGKQYYGIVPLRGKLLNVRDETASKINRNKEITVLKQMLGLRQSCKYVDDKDFEGLRYGHIMVMTDQDYDGSHIKGLIINFIHSMWPELLKRNGFLQQFITPIVVATKKGRNGEKIAFYTVPEYESWKRQQGNNLKKWKTKYYKGLGTWDAKSGKQHFRELNKHQVLFRHTGDDDDNSIVKAFSKKAIDQRKAWLAQYREGTFLDFNNNEHNDRHGQKRVTYQDFIDKEMILFSVEDNKRSIPSIMDGFKPGQRKVLYSCFLKNNLKDEVRVAQLSGYVSEKSAYHHGEASLNGTIINMAQDFIGTNNINLLEPRGMFGSRIKGGKDAASPRYIHTRLCNITRKLFVESDDAILKYLDDDGMPVEPQYYVPIIPMVLVNGSEGIGTGWSTFVPNYNPRDVISNLRRKINNEPFQEMKPYYRGFTGQVNIDKYGNHSVNTGSNSIGISVDLANLGGNNNNNNNNNNSNSNDNSNANNDNSERIVTGYTTNGIIELLEETETDSKTGEEIFTLIISELPVRTWTENYKKYLMELEESEQIVEFTDESTDVDVRFEIKIVKRMRPAAGGGGGGKGRKRGGKSKKKSHDSGDDDDDDDTMSMMTGNNDNSSERSISPSKAAKSGNKNDKNGKKTLKKKIYFEGVLDEQFLKDLKLIVPVSVRNMVLYDNNNKLRKYETVDDIMNEFYLIRYNFYEKRKEDLVKKMEHELVKLNNQVRFINMILNDELILKRKKKTIIVAELIKLKFDMWAPLPNYKDVLKKKVFQEGPQDDANEDESFDINDINGGNKKKKKKTKGNDDDSEEDDSDFDNNNNNSNDNSNDLSMDGSGELNEETLKKYVSGYNYLLNMPLWNLTYEKVEQICQTQGNKTEEMNKLKLTPIKDLWKTDLNELEKELDTFDQVYADNLDEMRRESKVDGAGKGGKGGKGKGKRGKTTKKKTTTTTKTKDKTKTKGTKSKTKSKKGKSTSLDDDSDLEDDYDFDEDDDDDDGFGYNDESYGMNDDDDDDWDYETTTTKTKAAAKKNSKNSKKSGSVKSNGTSKSNASSKDTDMTKTKTKTKTKAQTKTEKKKDDSVSTANTKTKGKGAGGKRKLKAGGGGGKNNDISSYFNKNGNKKNTIEESDSSSDGDLDIISNNKNKNKKSNDNNSDNNNNNNNNKSKKKKTNAFESSDDEDESSPAIIGGTSLMARVNQRITPTKSDDKKKSLIGKKRKFNEAESCMTDEDVKKDITNDNNNENGNDNEGSNDIINDKPPKKKLKRSKKENDKPLSNIGNLDIKSPTKKKEKTAVTKSKKKKKDSFVASENDDDDDDDLNIAESSGDDDNDSDDDFDPNSSKKQKGKAKLTKTKTKTKAESKPKAKAKGTTNKNTKSKNNKKGNKYESDDSENDNDGSSSEDEILDIKNNDNKENDNPSSSAAGGGGRIRRALREKKKVNYFSGDDEDDESEENYSLPSDDDDGDNDSDEWRPE